MYTTEVRSKNPLYISIVFYTARPSINKENEYLTIITRDLHHIELW